MEVTFHEGAEGDLEDCADFWELQEEDLGIEFLDFIAEELRGLKFIAGMHAQHRGVFRMLSRGKFPSYAIFYRVAGEVIEVLGIMDLRRDPKWINATLTSRLGG